MIKLFIFDMGGVLARNFNILPEAADILGVSYTKLLDYIGDDMTPLMEGSLSAEQFWNNFSNRSGITVERELWSELFNPVIDGLTKKLITGLKEHFRVVCGTNTMAEHFKVHENQGDYRIFDKVYASHIMRIAKPKSGFFKSILEDEDIKPEETVFADDFADNIDAAGALGINSFVFKDAVSFTEELNAANLGLAEVLSQLRLLPFLY